MKNIFSIVILALMFAACTNNAREEALIKQKAVAAVKDSLRLDSFKNAEVKAKEEAKIAQAKEEKRMLLLSERNEAAANKQYNNETIAPAKKKGWSQAAKGTVIGAGAGAIGGALIDKKKGRGAIVGGVVGAGTGYLIGRGQDRKSGRVQPKN
jgi:hypothetical protein